MSTPAGTSSLRPHQAQLASVLDLELWQSPAPGRAEQFDPDRFGEWLEGLVEAGEDVAAVVVTRMASSIVVTGLSRYVRVFDVAACSPIWSSLDEGSEVVWGGFDGLVAEVGGYVVRARRSDAWDAIVSLLLALHAEHGDFFQTIMRDVASSRTRDRKWTASTVCWRT